MRHDDQTAIRLAGKRGDYGLDLDAGMDVDGSHLDPKRRRHRLGRAQQRDISGRVRTEEHGHPAQVGRGLLEHPQPLAAHRRAEVLETGDIATRPRNAGDKTAADRVGTWVNTIGIVVVSR